jgi:hypothetical protein
MLGSVRYDTQNVFINNRHVEGSITHSASIATNKTAVMVAGTGFAGTSSSGPTTKEFSVGRNIVAVEDPITGFLTGSVNASFKYGTRKATQKSFSLNRGFVSSYSLAAAVGQVATSDFSIVGMARAGAQTEYNNSPSSPSYDIVVMRPGDVSVNVSGWETNRVQSFAYTANIERNPKYLLGGQRFIDSDFDRFVQNDVVYPIEINCDFEFEVDDYEIEDVQNMLCDPIVQNLNFSFSNCAGGGSRLFHAPNAELAEYSHEASTDGSLSVTVKYISRINEIDDLPSILSTNL